MAIQLGSAYGKVELDASGVQRGVSTATSSLQKLAVIGEKVGEVLKSVGTKLTIGLTIPILAMGAASIKAASDLEETRNKVNVVFGEMSESVLQWGEDSATAFGMSKQQALEAAGTFGNLFTSMGLGKEKSADMSQGLVQLAADLASFNNMDPNIVLEKLRSGLVGEVEPLRTLGVNLTMTAVKAKAMEMGLADASGQVSQAALVQARYALILEQTANAQGDFARTSDGLANQTRILRAEFQNALATLGQNLLPIALKVTQALNKMLEAFNNAPPFVQKGVLALLAFLALLGPLLSFIGTILSVASTLAGLGITASTVTTALTTIGTAIVGTVIPAIVSLGTAIWAALLPLLPVLALIAAAVLLVYLVWKNWDTLKITVEQLIFIIRFGLKKALDEVKKAAGDFKDEWNKSLETWKGNFQQAQEINQKVQQIAIEAMLKMIMDFVARASLKLTELRNWALTTWNSITSGFFAAWQAISNFFESVKNSIIAGIQAIKDAVNDLIASLQSVTLPTDLTPGSPTPFENGLRGIANAMRQLSSESIPELNRSFALAQAARSPAYAMAGANGNVISQTLNFADGLTERRAARLMDNRIESAFEQMGRMLENI